MKRTALLFGVLFFLLSGSAFAGKVKESWFFTPKDARKIWTDLPTIITYNPEDPEEDCKEDPNLPNYYSVPVKSFDLQNFQKAITLPDTLICRVEQSAIDEKITVDYFWKRGRNLYHTVPVIKRGNMLYIHKPQHVDEQNQINEFYNDFVDRCNGSQK